MQISSIRLDRFGACSDLSLDALTDGVNVIHGPSGSGKATIIRLVRSILFGFDDSTRRQYLPVDSRGYGGAITTRTLAGQQTITRVDDNTPSGLLTLLREDGTTIQHLPSEAIADVPESTFDRIYSVDYRRRPGIGALIEEAHASGLDLLGRGVDLERLADLEQQLRQQRDCLATIPRDEATHGELCERRVELLRMIRELESALDDQPDETALLRQIERLESLLSNGQVELQKLQTELDVAEQQRERILECRDSKSPVRQVDSPLVLEMNQLVSQIERWQSTLRDVTTRRQSLEESTEQLGSRESAGNPRSCLGEIESQLDGVQGTIDNIDDGASYQGHEIRLLFAEVFSGLRANVYRLCNQLSDWESTVRSRDCASEAGDLVRCETELQLAIRRASVRKESLQREIEAAFGEDAVALTPWNKAHCECAEHPPLQIRTQAVDVRTGWEHDLAVVSAEIAALEHRCDKLVGDGNEIESELGEARTRLRLLDHAELLDQLDAKRVELRRVDQNLRAAERRRELLSNIAATEAAIADLRTNTRTSTLIAKASEFLQRLTAGDLRKIEVAANEQVWVVDEHGRRRAYHQLSDGGRDLVYLSICLTLVHGFQARGIHVPMIVSGVFTHVDSKNVPEAAKLFRDFASQGHQLLLFTRHEHVASVFRLLNAPVRTLDRVGLPTSNLKQLDSSPAVSSFAANDAGDTFTLSEFSPIEEAPAIDATTATRLQQIGVMRVGDLLRLSSKSAAIDLREFGITSEQIISWKAQTRLVCEVPRLRGYDARLLVACGITEPEQLYRLSPVELRQIVKDVAASSTGQALMLSGTEFELSRVADWIGERAAKQSEPPVNDEVPDVVKMQTARPKLKFYLSLTDAVVDAPSIGARTAERLAAIGVETVDDLLNADAASISEQLEVKRFSTKVVTLWQQQTELACRVPQLRGHDAQVLVALGITDSEELAACDSKELWTLVEPFVDTKEGRRIIRNGKTPDLDEVTEWVQWAQASRQLHAA